MLTQKKPNRLVNEKSPYLLQHAYNPVDWFPWGGEAFEKARIEQKPIFLSIGYSTCHWCHVMERESFENAQIAAILNRHYVPIKVDREERPDVDRVYMTALQAMGQNGGWPLSMFLTPELQPFYGGTYFPPETRYGRIGFPDLLHRIQDIWQNERPKVLESGNGITSFLRQLPEAGKSAAVDEGVFETCFRHFNESFDPRFGGFAGAPKFPRPVVFAFLLRYYYRTGNPEALKMSAFTLRKMWEGGMYDHIGGGFHRYSVDGEWRVPHFEKMLYDQAQIVNALVDTYLITKDTLYGDIIRSTLGYVLRDLQSPLGAFYSAEDADSARPESPDEEGEGAFYLWTKKELLGILGEEVGRIFCFHYGVEEGGNALFDPQHEFTGRNILYVAHPAAETARMFERSESEIASPLQNARVHLLQIRSERPRPHLDDKILTSWNGLMISALARASQALDDAAYIQAAERAATFVLEKLFDRGEGGLMRRYRDGEARYEGSLDDYAFFVQGLLDLYEAALDVRWLERAIELTILQIDLFWDGVHSGFFETTGRDSSLLVRLKEQYDGAEPAGNSIAALNLLRLAEMTDNHDWRRKAEECFSLFGESLSRQPNVMPQMAAALDFMLSKTKQVVIAGPRDHPGTQRMLREVHTRYLPNKVVLLVDGAKQQERVSTFLPFVGSLAIVGGNPTAYVCENYACKLPTTDPVQLGKLLEGKS